MRDDAELARRDPALPALATTLSGEAARWALGAAATQIRPHYVRYKPGVSVVVGARVERADGGSEAVQVVAMRPGEGKLQKIAALEGATGDTVRGIAVVPDAADRDLPGIAVARSRHPEAEVAVYKPGRRWVAICRACRVVVKVHRPAVADVAVRAHALVAAGLPTARIVRSDVARGIVETAFVEGVPLDALRRADGAAARAGERAAGGALAALHASPAGDADDLAAWRTLRRDELEGAAAAVAAILPDLAPRAAHVARRVLAVIGRRDALARIHGDFSADQVIVQDDGGVAIIDLDRAGIGDPLHDLATWAADGLAAGAAPGAALGDVGEGYRAAQGGEDQPDLRMLAAGALLQRAVEPFRLRRPEWRADAERLLAQAELLAGAEPVDAALPGLDALLAEPGATLLVHRPGRRAVVRVPGAAGAWYAKAVRPSRFAKVAERARRVEDIRAVRVPQVLAADAAAGVIRLASAGERTLLDLGRDPDTPAAAWDAVWRRVARGVAEVQRLDGAGLPAHDAAAEEQVAREAAERAAHQGRLAGDAVDAAVVAVARDLAGEPCRRAVLHRDLHDKQLLVPAGPVTADPRVGMIDVDTLAVGEAALDVGNLLAHTELRVLQGTWPEARARAAADALRDELDRLGVWGEIRARVPAYVRSTRLRLAGVYAVRAGEERTARALLERAAE